MTDYVAQCHQVMEELHLRGVHLIGPITQRELRGYLRHAIALVQPSAQENAPMAIAEAMVLGTPVVASRVGGVPCMIRDQCTGLLYEAGDISGLTTCLRSLLDDPLWRASLGRRAQTLARITYAPECVAAATVDLYRRLINEAGYKRYSELLDRNTEYRRQNESS